jgi:hypothetical protein
LHPPQNSKTESRDQEAHNTEESDSLSKAADPGKLKGQKEGTAWSRGLRNFLSTTLAGQDTVPMSCIIREDDAPDCKIETEPDSNFEQLTIDCDPTTDIVFKTAVRKVHHLIHGFVHGETA